MIPTQSPSLEKHTLRRQYRDTTSFITIRTYRARRHTFHSHPLVSTHESYIITITVKFPSFSFFYICKISFLFIILIIKNVYFHDELEEWIKWAEVNYFLHNFVIRKLYFYFIYCNFYLKFLRYNYIYGAVLLRFLWPA